MDAYLGEIRIFAGTYAPAGWALCNGALMSVQNYPALYALIGTAYGGDGQTTFCLPNLSGRIPLGLGTTTDGTISLGQMGGQDHITLTEANLPPHTHTVTASSTQATQQVPSPSQTFGTLPEPQRMYIDTSKVSGTPTPFSDKVIGYTGLGQSYVGTMPQLALTFIICVNGLYPNFPS